MASSKRLVYLDSGVLIAAARGKEPIADAALAALDDNKFEFASSFFVQLEVLPKPQFHKRQDEVHFYETYFSRVSAWVELDRKLVEVAYAEAKRAGLSAVDALHVAAAVSSGAELLITSEGADKAIHRTTLISVRSIQPNAA